MKTAYWQKIVGFWNVPPALQLTVIIIPASGIVYIVSMFPFIRSHPMSPPLDEALSKTVTKCHFLILNSHKTGESHQLEHVPQIKL